MIEREAFKALDAQKASCVLNMLFGYYNWLRELLSTFACEKENDIQVNILRRLQATCDVQSTLIRLLGLAKFAYDPPTVLATATTVVAAGGSSSGSGVSSTQQSQIPSSAKSQKSSTQAKTSQVFPLKLIIIKNQVN